LAHLAVGHALLRPAPERGGGDGQVHQNLLLWFVLSFALFSMMITKFHHYVFPAVPPLAMLIAIALDRVTPEAPPAPSGSLGWRIGAWVAIAAAVLLPTWILATESEPRWDLLRHLPFGPAWPVLLLLGGTAGVLAKRAGLVDRAEPRDPAIAAVFLAAAALLLCVTRDLADVAS